MKYYLAQIDTRNGEYETSETIKFKTDYNPDKVLDDIARQWFDEENDGEYKHSEWYWHNMEVVTRAGLWQEISKATYLTLPYFISEFTE
jgi:hypothetical protein